MIIGVTFRYQYQKKIQQEDPRVKQFLKVQKKVEKSMISLAAERLDKTGRTILTNQFMENNKVGVLISIIVHR